MKRAMVYANEGHITPILFQDIVLWELIEAIEMSTDYYEQRNAAT